MTSLADARIRVPMPAGWARMPPPDEQEASTWTGRVVEESGATGAPADRLHRALEGALRTAAAQQDPRRLRWVLVGPSPVHSLQAWASLQVVERTEADPEAGALAFDAAARTVIAEQPGVLTWHRESVRRRLATGPAVVVHDLLTVETSPGADPAALQQSVQQRAVVALFPEPPVVVTLELSTPRLTAFADIAAAATAIADGIRLEDAP